MRIFHETRRSVIQMRIQITPAWVASERPASSSHSLWPRLEIYEESKAMALFNRACVAKAVALAQCMTGEAVDPSIDDADHDETFLDDDFFYREAA